MIAPPEPDFRTLLGRYPAHYAANDAAPARRFEGFSGARVWRAETSAGPCALRATNPSHVDPARLAGLHRLIAHLRDCGVAQVPAPIHTLSGATFFEDDGAHWQLEPWMPGSADFWKRPTPERLRAALECLARVHIAAGRFDPHSDEANWFFRDSSAASPGLAERLRGLKGWDQSRRQLVRQRLESSADREFADPGMRFLEAFARWAPRLAADLELAAATRVPLQPCLRDVWHDHILYSGDAVTGLIDLHAARSDSVATDLARLLGSLVLNDRQGWETGLAAYQRIRPLSLDELALVGLFDRSSVLLSGMTWLDWICIQRREFSDRTKVLSRVKAIVRRFDGTSGFSA